MRAVHRWACPTSSDVTSFGLVVAICREHSITPPRGNHVYTLDSVIFWNTEAKKNMWFVVKILTFTSARWQTSFILDLTWHTDSCTSLLQRPPRSVDVASCTDPGQLKILHRSRASSSPCYHRLSPISGGSRGGPGGARPPLKSCPPFYYLHLTRHTVTSGSLLDRHNARVSRSKRLKSASDRRSCRHELIMLQFFPIILLRIAQKFSRLFSILFSTFFDIFTDL